MLLEALRTQALRYLALGDYARALKLYAHAIRQLPHDFDARMRVGDICSQVQRKDLATRVYAAVALLDLQGGRPLHGIVAMRALTDLGHDVSQLHSELGQLYGAGSPRVARVGARLAPPLGDTQIDAPNLTSVEPGPTLTEAVMAASDTTSIKEFPAQFQPVPLLSDLSDRAFSRVLGSAAVHRLGHGSQVIRQGDPGDAFFLVASGMVRVHTTDDTGRQLELARLGEGAIFGEMAIINAQPRSASVEVLGSADILAFGRRSIQAAADELSAVAAALDRFTRDRLLRNVAATSPLFRPFTPEQRTDLLRKFTGREVAAGEDVISKGDPPRGLHLVLSGEVEVVTGDPPFETVLARLGPGECFGEISLIRRQPAVATVRATRRGQVLVLTREYFDRLVSALPAMREFFEALSDERTRANESRTDGSPFSGDEDDAPLF